MKIRFNDNPERDVFRDDLYQRTGAKALKEYSDLMLSMYKNMEWKTTDEGRQMMVPSFMVKKRGMGNPTIPGNDAKEAVETNVDAGDAPKVDDLVSVKKVAGQNTDEALGKGLPGDYGPSNQVYSIGEPVSGIVRTVGNNETEILAKIDEIEDERAELVKKKMFNEAAEKMMEINDLKNKLADVVQNKITRKMMAVQIDDFMVKAYDDEEVDELVKGTKFIAVKSGDARKHIIPADWVGGKGKKKIDESKSEKIQDDIKDGDGEEDSGGDKCKKEKKEKPMTEKEKREFNRRYNSLRSKVRRARGGNGEASLLKEIGKLLSSLMKFVGDKSSVAKEKVKKLASQINSLRKGFDFYDEEEFDELIKSGEVTGIMEESCGFLMDSLLDMGYVVDIKKSDDAIEMRIYHEIQNS